jgi:hypothetical protein
MSLRPYQAYHCWRAGVVYQARTPAEWLAWVEAQQQRLAAQQRGQWRVLVGGRP